MRLSALLPLVLAAAVTSLAPSAVASEQLPLSTERLAAESPYDCPEPDGKSADGTGPGRFHHCTDGVPHPASCAPYQPWTQEARRCEWPQLANNPGAEPPRAWRLP